MNNDERRSELRSLINEMVVDLADVNHQLKPLEDERDTIQMNLDDLENQLENLEE